MSSKKIFIIIMGAVFIFTAFSASGDTTLPDSLVRPQKGEAPRYPHDLIIGELGKGQASDNAYAYAKNALNALLKASPNFEGADADSWERALVGVKTVSPQKFRLGGGREEIDGSTSFIFRFIGREQWIVGELYIRFETIEEKSEEEKASVDNEEESVPAAAAKSGWRIDDIILDDPKKTGEGGEPYPYDFSPYERFF